MNFDIKNVKIFVTVPVEYVDRVRTAVCEAGAGVIGNYTYCTSSTKSMGTFKPNEKAKPFIGNIGKLEFVEEEKLEFICKIENVKQVLVALRQAHPYEEPAIDIMPLIDEGCIK